MDIKSKVSKSIAICFIGLLFTFAFTWIIFDFQKSSNSLKDTWTIITSLFSGITTLLAAYIATLLFNDWKEQHNKQILAFEAKKLHLDLSEFMKVIAEFETTKLNIDFNYVNLSNIHKQFHNLYGAHSNITIPLLDFMDLSKQNIINELISDTTNQLNQQDLSLKLYKKGKEADLIKSIENTCHSIRCNINAIKDLLESYIFVK